MRQVTSHELQVDIRRCDAYGYCAEMLPDIVERDEWGYPIVASDIGPGRLDDARAAALACPKLALRLRAKTRAGEPAAG